MPVNVLQLTPADAALVEAEVRAMDCGQGCIVLPTHRGADLSVLVVEAPDSGFSWRHDHVVSGRVVVRRYLTREEALALLEETL